MNTEKIADIANKEVHKNYPLLEHPIKGWTIPFIVDAIKEEQLLFDEEINLEERL